jgi:hypothetical protein
VPEGRKARIVYSANTSKKSAVTTGSDGLFRVEKQSSVRLYRLIGTVSVQLHFEE